MHDDLFIEMLDVFFNSILYLRDVYPSAIFRRRRIYSTAIYASIYPPLNEYLEKILKTALELKTERKLRKVELIIFREEQSIFDDVDDDDIIEKYVFQVEEKEESRTQDIANLPEYLLKFEDDLRQALAQLNYVLKNMKPLQSAECSFRIELETTEKAFVELVNRTNSQAEVRSFRSEF